MLSHPTFTAQCGGASVPDTHYSEDFACVGHAGRRPLFILSVDG